MMQPVWGAQGCCYSFVCVWFDLTFPVIFYSLQIAIRSMIEEGAFR